MSRRQTPHQRREKSRNRRALDRAIVKAVIALEWSRREASNGYPLIDTHSAVEIVGLSIARKRI